MEGMNQERLQRLYQRAIADGGATRGAHLPPERIEALVAGTLGEDDRLAALDHVMGCPECRHGYDLLATLRASRPAPVTRFLIPLGLAATAVLAVGILGSRLRSGRDDPTRGGQPPVVVAPTGEVGGGPIRFVWRPAPGAREYRIELLDSRGNQLHAAVTADTGYALPGSVTLAAGEYQWLVTADPTGSGPAVSEVGRFRVAP
jgi:hypothetical protein